jgi:hypothetical protein
MRVNLNTYGLSDRSEIAGYAVNAGFDSAHPGQPHFSFLIYFL